MRFGLIIALLLSGLHATAGSVPVATFAVLPAQPLMDDRLEIKASGLPPNQLITFSATSVAQDRLEWRSVAVFTSRPDGTVDPGAQAPVSGTYRGIDAMGLFWSMEPDADAKSGDHAFFAWSDWLEPVVTEIDGKRGKEVLASVRIERRFARPGVQRTAIGENGIVGVLYSPGDHQPHPAVILIGGSEGGFGGPEAAMLASRGFAALSLAYFGLDGLPPTLQSVPIEYFDKAVRWMRARAEVDPERVAVFGISRGTEAALMLAAENPHLEAVVARAPSHVRWEGLTARHLPGGPAWTLDGRALPYVPNRIPIGFALLYLWDIVVGTPVRQSPLFLRDLAYFGDTAGVEIPVEQVRGPLLLLSGQDDQIWPSAMMAERIIERLRRNRHPYGDGLLSYEEAGHWLPTAYVPMRGLRKGMKVAIGGTPEGTARAQADSWPKIRRFLTRALTMDSTDPGRCGPRYTEGREKKPRTPTSGVHATASRRQ